MISYVAGAPCRKNQCHADESVAMAEHESEAPGVEEDSAETGVDDALHENVDSLARAAESGFQHREANLHAEDQKRRDQRPHCVDRVDDVIALEFRIGGERTKPEKIRIEKGHRDEKHADGEQFPRKAAARHICATPDRATGRVIAPTYPIETVVSSCPQFSSLMVVVHFR